MDVFNNKMNYGRMGGMDGRKRMRIKMEEICEVNDIYDKDGR